MRIASLALIDFPPSGISSMTGNLGRRSPFSYFNNKNAQRGIPDWALSFKTTYYCLFWFLLVTPRRNYCCCFSLSSLCFFKTTALTIFAAIS